MAKVFLAYMPVYHRGWVDFFARYPLVRDLVLLSAADLRSLAPTHKDIHGLSAPEMKVFLAAANRFERVGVMNKKLLAQWQKNPNLELIIPKDETVQAWVRQNLPLQKNVIESDIFLRWTRENSLAVLQIKTRKKASLQQVMLDLQLAIAQGEKSSDWWRRVGCVLCLHNGEKIITHNTHLPEAQTPYINGDVRAQFHKGDHFELTTAIHAEAKAIAQAAKNGWSTQDATLMVTDFPCPVCAKLIAQAGIKKVYFQKGYAMLDGETILRAFDVELVQLS